MPRNRVIYQSDALFVTTGTVNPTGTHAATDIGQLHRVQSASYGFNVSRQDINQFGNLARIDAIILEAPTVNLDFTYYLHDGTNERLLGFVTGATSTGLASVSNNVFLSGLINADTATTVNGIPVGGGHTVSGRNYFIFTSPEGVDANGATLANISANSNTIGIGNGYVTNYSVEASVGSIPTVSVTVEGSNINVVSGSSGTVPGTTTENNATGNLQFQLPAPVSGSLGLSALRPGDIYMSLSEGLLTDLPTADNASNTAAHIQSFSIEVPIKRTTLQRIGNAFGYTKVVDFPLEVTVNVSANVADLKDDAGGSAGANLMNLLVSDASKTLTFQFADSTKTSKIAYTVRGCKIVSENFSSSIGDNKKVDLVFTTQIGSPTDALNGIFAGVTAGLTTAGNT